MQQRWWNTLLEGDELWCPEHNNKMEDLESQNRCKGVEQYTLKVKCVWLSIILPRLKENATDLKMERYL